MTPDQLISMYQESFRQEAREALMSLHVMSILKSKDPKSSIYQLELLAFPPDPEVDEDFGKDTLKELKGILQKEGII